MKGKLISTRWNDKLYFMWVIVRRIRKYLIYNIKYWRLFWIRFQESIFFIVRNAYSETRFRYPALYYYAIVCLLVWFHLKWLGEKSFLINLLSCKRWNQLFWFHLFICIFLLDKLTCWFVRLYVRLYVWLYEFKTNKRCVHAICYKYILRLLYFVTS